MTDAPSNYKALLQKAFLSIDELQNRLKSIEAAKREPIAIIGMSCRFPGGGDDPQSFWQLLHNGVDTISEIPPDRWDVEALYSADPDEPGKMYTRWGGFLKHIDLFDANFFGISPREAACLDPQQRLALEVAWEALETTGYPVSSFAGSQTGVFMGASTTDYGIRLLSAPQSIDIYTGTGISNNVLAGRLSYLLDLQGPCVAIDTACSSSLVALHLACQSLRSRESNLALVGGVNIMLLPSFFLIFSKTRMMSPDGRCKTFDARANGYVRGEGCGMVVLKRLSDALADRDRILAVVRGTAINQDGKSSGITAPNLLAQQRVIKQALDNAGVKPNQVSYVEAHGTGTSLGDPIEIEGLKATYGAASELAESCYVASVKTNIGHLEAAAGIAALIKTVLSLQNQTIVANLHLQQLNPNISLAQTRLKIPTTATAWQSDHRFAGISSFGWSGTNSHVIVEEAAPYLAKNTSTKNEVRERPYNLLTISAKSPGALQSLTQKYQDFISHSDLTSLSVSSHITRNHFNNQRLAVVAPDKGQLLEQLNYAQEEAHVVPSKHGRVAFLFTGQGAQYSDMGRQLYNTEPLFRQIIDQCNDIAQPYLAEPLLDVIYPKNDRAKELIHQTAYTQPALFAIEYALAKLWQNWGVEPDALIGHSIGEYAAACLAGVFSLSEGLQLVAARGRLMQSLPQNGLMAAIFAPLDRVEQLIASYPTEVSIAGINSLENIVISGHHEAISNILATCTVQDISYQQLKVSHPFHSPLLEPILAEFRQVANSVEYHAPQITLISNLTGKEMTKAPDANYWCQHLREAVQFVGGMQTLAAQGCEVFIEVGPHPVLTGLGKTILPETTYWLASLKRHSDDWAILLNSLAELYCLGFNIDWRKYDQDYLDKKILLPTYTWDKESYWHEALNWSNELVQPLSKDELWDKVTQAAQHQAEQAPLDLELSQYIKDDSSITQICYYYIAAAQQHLSQQGSTELLPSYQHLMTNWQLKLANDQFFDKAINNHQLVSSLTQAELLATARQLSAQLEIANPALRPILQLIAQTGKQLADIMTGKVSAQAILFDPPTLATIRQIYHRADIRYFMGIIKEILNTYQKTSKSLRILEIGDRIAENTTSLLATLNKCEYYYCDSNDLALNQAKESLANYPQIQYQLLNISQDPAEQGIQLHQFDIVIATYVIHTAPDIDQVLVHIDNLLAPQGLLIALENTQLPTWVEISFALLEDWQHYGSHRRTTHATLPREEWLAALTARFGKVASWPSVDSPAKVLGQNVLVAQTDWVADNQISANPNIKLSTASAPVALAFDFTTFFTSNETEQQEQLIEFLSLLTAKVMRLPITKLDKQVSIKNLGFESLMIVELRNQIKRSLGVTLALDNIPASSVVDLAQLLKPTILAPGFVKPSYKEQPAEIEIPKLIDAPLPVNPVAVAVSNPWLICRKPNPNAKLRLFCFHHGGGNAVAFHHWSDLINSEIEVFAIQMPGRSERMGETLIKRMSTAAQEITAALLPYLDRPFAFFGHSMGSLIAFEVTRQLRKQQAPLPIELFLASRRDPQSFDTSLPIHMLPDEQFIAELKRYNGLDEAVVQEKELLKLLLPILRADFTIIDTYVYASEPPFNIPITVLGGQDDQSVTEMELKNWQEQTTVAFELKLFPGGHFFLREHYQEICQLISHKLAANNK